jgi:hypothetical protein
MLAAGAAYWVGTFVRFMLPEYRLWRARVHSAIDDFNDSLDIARASLDMGFGMDPLVESKLPSLTQILQSRGERTSRLLAQTVDLVLPIALGIAAILAASWRTAQWLE